MTANIAGGLILALSPLLVTVIMLGLTGEATSRAGWSRLGMGRSGIRHWPAAIGANVAVSVIATCLVVLLGFATFTRPEPDLATTVIALAITGPILAFAEEIGWRGYLLPRMTWLGRRPRRRRPQPCR
ncbi:hypothetical protein [Nocardia lijiangensis]|uniref:hypothetical protein n=1 Tax=Nocardia lijiangensis TaxID=299618 RepID=UPI0012DF3B7D|nr:hypothetical protein [Nocardia lijiangensis]